MSEDDRAVRALSFGAEAEAYEAARPDYPEAAVKPCLPPAPGRVLDLGAGTGKLTKAVLALGHEVVAVEPIDDMRARIDPRATAHKGTAESIPLPDASVDAVVVGQAYHWFDQPVALTEIARVLKPGGTLGLIWNLLDDREAWVAALAEAMRAPDRAGYQPDEAPWDERPDYTTPVEVVVAHEQRLDVDGLILQTRSRSPYINATPADQEEMLTKVRALAPAGEFGLPFVCHAWHATRV